MNKIFRPKTSDNISNNKNINVMEKIDFNKDNRNSKEYKEKNQLNLSFDLNKEIEDGNFFSDSN